MVEYAEHYDCICGSEGTIPKDKNNKDYQKVLRLITLGEVTLIPYVAPPENPKIERDHMLNEMCYDFNDGRVMQTRPQDEQNIRNAIDIMENNNYSICHWVMLDNVKYEVTLEELKTSLKEGQKQAMRIWNNYNP
jgi:hypothetical protein